MNFLKKKLDRESKRLIKNSKWVFIANIIGAGLAFLRSVVIARGLGVEIFGTYAMVIAFVSLLQEFLNLNLGTAIIKFGANFQAENRMDKLAVMIRRCIKTSFVMSLVLVLVVAVLTHVSYDTFIKKPHLHWFVIGYAIANSVAYYNLITKAALRLFFRFKKNSVIQIIMDLIETLMMVLAVLLYPKNLTVFFAAAIATRFLNALVCNALGFLEMKKELWVHRHAPAGAIAEDVPAIRKFVISNSLGNTLKALIHQGDVLLLGILAGPLSVGFYAVAKKLAYSVLTITDPLVNSVYPQFSKLIAERRVKEVIKMLKRISLVSVIPASGFLILCFFFKAWIISKVYGTEYMEAASPFFFLLINAVIGSLTFWVLPLVQSLGLVSMRLKVYAFMILFGVISSYLLVPLMGASGMAVSLLVINSINNFVFIFASLNAMKDFQFKTA